MIKILKNLKKIDLLYLVASIGLIVFQVWLDLTMPDYTARLTSSVSSGDILKEEVLKNGGMMLLCAFGSMSAAIATGWFSSHIAANFAKTLRTKLFDKITSFSDREMNYFTTPSLITRTGNDVVQMQMLVAMGMQVMIKAPILAVWALFKISVTSIEWTTATLCTIAVMLVTIGTVVGLSYPKFKMIQKLTDNLNDVTREGVSGVRVVRAFNAESYQEGKFDKVNRDVTRTHLFTSRTMGVLFPIITLCMSGLTLAIYWIGAVLVNATANPLERIDTIGNMTAFSQYALQVVMAFMMLVAIFILLPRSMVSARRINEVLDTAPSITYISSDGDTKTRKKKAKQDSSSSGRLEFENVFFSYPDASNPCLKDISFAASPGETLAIIGATGSGKTSLISLITRFYDATQGRVLIDGRDIKDFTKKELEDTVSIATQKAILFSGSIRSNITYGSKDAPSPDDVDKEQPESEEKDNAQPKSDASDTPIDPR
ncbi:MAG: ABC transporter ATP-binding protein, partial [Lachnospiraceae bacterium]|nr:ABC transporter ATP-binding protein [Lachnospiraceae bacterium]